jgi:hypothetical protein
LTILFHSAYLCQSAFSDISQKTFHHRWCLFGSLHETSSQQLLSGLCNLADFIQCKSSEHVLSELINICLEFFYVGR